MIDQPGFRVRLEQAESDRIVGSPVSCERIREFVGRYRKRCRESFPAPACKVTIEQELPSHNGLGSGTQIGLAIARGLSLLAGEPNVDLIELARRSGRGRRSAVGLYGFEQGGLIVDAGQSAGDAVGALACRLELPTAWRVLLITPPESGAGLSGAGEEQAFETLGSMPLRLTERLCHLVVTELLPAVQSARFDDFSQGLHAYGRLVGEFFAPVQGGVFGHPRTDALIAQLRELGICGTGQTSWGPTVFAFVPDAQAGEDVRERLGGECAVQLVSLRNVGAEVECW